jgi:ABC-2 type transport system permease protein
MWQGTFWRKISAVFSISWASGFVYRLNFVMWRFRTIIQLLTVYFLWWAILQNNPAPAGYVPETLLTYVVLTSIIRAVVFSSRSTDVQSNIGSGDLNNYLIKPINYFGYWFSRDIADKALNLLFSMVEISLILFLLKPPLFLQTDPLILLFFSLSVILAALMYFFFSFIISLSVFWAPEGNGWPQRFLIFIILEFFAGALFPLDILPQPVFAVLSRLPTAFFLYTPLSIYLGRSTPAQSLESLGLMVFWLGVLYVLSQGLFKRGLKIYGAYGR